MDSRLEAEADATPFGRAVPAGRRTSLSSGRFVIVTADDFGLHPAVNEAVEIASRSGGLDAASLMVGAPAAADAVRRARRLPALRVGLHVVLADGVPMLPPGEIAALVDRGGRFRSRLVLDGVRYFLSPHARAQLEAEIRAQFRAFAATGLALDHVNMHKHLHLHPTLLALMLRIGDDFGLRAVRLPAEPPAAPGDATARARAARLALQPWLGLLRRRLDRARLLHNDWLIGIRHSGAMDETALLAALARLPPGATEICLHPATQSGALIAPSMHGYRHADELAALCSARVAAALTRVGAPRGGYQDLASWHELRWAA